jgi:regulator of sirC expression with transglutaminase-like and TPR domain
MARPGRLAYHPAVTGHWNASRHPFPDGRDSAGLRAEFARLAGRPDPLVDLGAAWACISAQGNPLIGPETQITELDGLAERVRTRLPGSLRSLASSDAAIRSPDEIAAILDALHHLLYVDLGLHGAPRDDWDPAHGYLGDVLDRKRGLPVALGVIELEVGWRLGLPLYGIGLPGHFILGGPSGLIDPYGGGRPLSDDDCREVVRAATGRRLPVHPVMLRPAPRREILARILGNVRGIYLARREWSDALWTIDYLLILDPADPGLGRDRALVLGRLGQFTAAVGGLRRYLDEEPDAQDRDEVRLALGIFGGRRN